MQCHWLQFRNWLGAQYIPAGLWDRHLFPLQLSLFIVFQSWQVFSQESSCLAKNSGRPLRTDPLVTSCLWFSSLKWVREFGYQFLLGFQILKNEVYNKHLVGDLRQYAPLRASVYFTRYGNSHMAEHMCTTVIPKGVTGIYLSIYVYANIQI